MLGLHFVLGLDFSPTMTVCQVPGEALRLPAYAFWDSVRPGNYLDHLLRRYAAFYFRCATRPPLAIQRTPLRNGFAAGC